MKVAKVLKWEYNVKMYDGSLYEFINGSYDYDITHIMSKNLVWTIAQEHTSSGMKLKLMLLLRSKV